MQNLKPYEFLMMQILVGIITGIITSLLYEQMCKHAHRYRQHRSQFKTQQ